jgi:molybdate transport system ATP-binding protein
LSALEARLTRRVHARLVLDVSIGLGAECGVVFGPSGSGKTSLLRMIAGLDRPDSGRLRLGDAVLFDSDAKRETPLRDRRIGMIFQDDLLFPHLDAAANVRFGLKGWRRAEADARLAEVAALCGIEGLLDRRPATLSGGERQRVGLARALAPRPRLLLCDEPVSALDLPGRNALVDRLRAVQRAEAIPVLYVTHSPEEAIALGSRLFLLRGGRIAAEGAPLDLLAAEGFGASGRLEGVRNVFHAVVARHDEGGTVVRLDGGPELVVARQDRAVGSALAVGVRSDEILLARSPVEGLSARNVLPGRVGRVVAHAGGAEVEVLARTGSVDWLVGVVPSAVAALGLAEGVEVWLIVKARSVRVLESAGRAGDGRASPLAGG